MRQNESEWMKTKNQYIFHFLFHFSYFMRRNTAYLETVQMNNGKEKQRGSCGWWKLWTHFILNVNCADRFELKSIRYEWKIA